MYAQYYNQKRESVIMQIILQTSIWQKWEAKNKGETWLRKKVKNGQNGDRINIKEDTNLKSKTIDRKCNI